MEQTGFPGLGTTVSVCGARLVCEFQFVVVVVGGVTDRYEM